MHFYATRILAGIIAACMIASGYAAAQEQDSLDKGVSQEITAGVRSIPQSSVDAQSGDVSIVDAGVSYGYEFRVREKLPVKLTLGMRYIGIDNSSPVEMPAHLNASSLDIETTLQLFNVDNTYFRFGLTPSLLGDSWNYAASDFRIPFRMLCVYKPDDIWLFAAGVAVLPGFEQLVIPVAGFIYRPNDIWTFRLIAPRPSIDYRMTERLSLFAEGGFSGGEYEVTKGELKSAVLQYKEVSSGAGLRYKITDTLTGSCSAGGVFSRALKYRDSLGKVSIDNGAYAALRLSAQF